MLSFRSEFGSNALEYPTVLWYAEVFEVPLNMEIFSNVLWVFWSYVRSAYRLSPYARRYRGATVWCCMCV